MKGSELIKNVQSLIDTHGDHEVSIGLLHPILDEIFYNTKKELYFGYSAQDQGETKNEIIIRNFPFGVELQCQK